MPYSSGEGKEWARARYEATRPGTVLEVGPGAGMWSKLLRPVHRGHWTAVEVFAPYVDRFGLNDLYDEVIVQDVRETPAAMFAVDLVIMGDVIEHLERGDGLLVLAKARKHARRILLATPIIPYPQGPSEGNEHEAHLDSWSQAEMDAELPGAEAVYGTQIGTWWYTHPDRPTTD